MKDILLKNGAREPDVLVAATLVTLNHLLEKELPGTLAAYDLVMLARDPDYYVFPPSMEILKKFSLVEADGRVHDSIRNVVLSWSSGEGWQMKFGVDPVQR